MKQLTLEQIPLFASLSQDEIQELAASLQQIEIPAGTVLFYEGETGDCFYTILDGQVEIVKALGTPDERLLNLRGPGEFLGEMSMFDRDGLRTASVRARTGVQLLKMTHANLDALLHRQPALAFELLRVLSLRLREADNAMIRDLQEKNRLLAQAYKELKAAQDQIIEKEKLERELQLARQIQESMLPKRLPRMREFDFGARMLPARAVGGDFFDFVLVDREHLGIVIGDVSDKGVPAALFMALVRSLLRSEAMRELSPKKVLGNINRCLLHMNAAGMFVTVLYGVLNRKKHEFCYARAGHEYPILLDEHGSEIEPGEGLGQLLGLLSEPEIYEQTITIPAKGTLLLYTDGVLDAIDDQGVLYGRERLQEILRSSLLTTAQGVCDQVLEAVMAYQSMNPQADDITLVAVRAR